MRLSGLAGLPTYSRGNAQMQYVYVNGRPVRDKLFAGAIRAAYLDFLRSDRHPVAALFIDCDPRSVDVNVHPAKAEVRFADPGLVRGLVVGALKQALTEKSHRSADTNARAAIDALARGNGARCRAPAPANWRLARSPYAPAGFEDQPQAAFDAGAPIADARAHDSPTQELDVAARRGARAAARNLHHRPDAGRSRHRRPARGA